MGEADHGLYTLGRLWPVQLHGRTNALYQRRTDLDPGRFYIDQSDLHSTRILLWNVN
jgi:hypothetical protein